MPRRLPHHRKRSGQHQREEKALQNNRKILQVVSIHINSRQTTDYCATRHEAHPIPLPSSANYSKPFIFSKEQASMFPEVYQRKHNAGHE